jgi:hypothetical protein
MKTSIRGATLALGTLALLATAGVTTLAGCGSAPSAAAAPKTTTHLTFDIFPVKPGGPATDHPAYSATSPTTLPANTVVMVTIRNFDLGDDSLPANSPFLNVQGVTGSATMDGKAFTSLGGHPHRLHLLNPPAALERANLWRSRRRREVRERRVQLHDACQDWRVRLSALHPLWDR